MVGQCKNCIHFRYEGTQEGYCAKRHEDHNQYDKCTDTEGYEEE